MLKYIFYINVQYNNTFCEEHFFCQIVYPLTNKKYTMDKMLISSNKNTPFYTMLYNFVNRLLINQIPMNT